MMASIKRFLWVRRCAAVLRRRGGLKREQAKSLAIDLFRDFGSNQGAVETAEGEMSYWGD